jgi:ABC-type polysaccharide/polyol phosphate transport system ATPase subunit
LIKHQLQGGHGKRLTNERFSEVLTRVISTPFRRRNAEELAASREEFWALKDVSFEIKRGEVVGIIGRNGAGKSTLLKILSRITEPTTGRIEIDGRVASLLEVGTGFHPELTGRENIFLNGAILGMSRIEIKSKFDEIVAFAEVEKFLDTPVKRYSSGMYVRLAFAVAAHLEPEILIVDEVLAVGDAQFQKKCLGKMQDVSRNEGRTVLFVSHNVAAITSLTERILYLQNGGLCFDGNVSEGIQAYLSKPSSSKAGEYLSSKADSRVPYISSAMVIDSSHGGVHQSGDDFEVHFQLEHNEPINGACFSFQIVNYSRQPIIHCWLYDADSPLCRKSGPTKLVCKIPKLSLNIGNYTLNAYFSEGPGGNVFEQLENICEFSVEVLQKQTLFGWRPNACAMIVPFTWTENPA